ncbi:MAG: polysaccharide biosynthesis C-terminal domain-containing protein [Lachnospiraceae bacterium]|nr:polysaccharide biosynthesis C-terminal domain-containing protein [Lachnospiraceae bacterium]
MKELDLLNDPVRKTILQFSIPTILGMAATQLYTVADTMIIGRFMDKYALGAVSNASTVLMAFLFISGGLELGCGLLTASQRPKLEQKELSGLIYNMLFLDLVVGLLILCGGLWGMERFLLLINTPAEIMDAAMLYGRIYLLGLPFLMLYDLSRQIVISCGESRVPLLAVLASSALNIILDLVLVGPLGVAGAAAASVLAQVLGCVFMLTYLRRTVIICGFRLHFLEKRCFWDILRLSVPNTLQQIAPPAVALVKQGLLGTLGVAEIDGFACAGKLSTLMMMPVYGFAQSLVVFIAQNHSVGAVNRIQSSIRETRNLILVYMSVVVFSCLLLNQQLLAMFTDDTAVIRCGSMLLAFESWTYMLTAMKHLQEARLRGEMKMGIYMVSSLLPICINIACCLMLVPRLGYSGFYLSTFVSAPFSLLLAMVLVKYFTKINTANTVI